MANLPWFARLLLAALTLLLVGAAFAESAAPTTPAELAARLKQLKQYYAPYLRSLPKPLQVRKSTDLSGVWRWKFEKEQFPGGARPPAPDWYRVDFDDSAWEKTTVPEWRYDAPAPYGTTPNPQTRPENRIAWYRTSFAAVPPVTGQQVFLSFAGVAWEAEVWLNGQFLGRHTAYWEPFRFDVTHLLQPKNVLAVRTFSGSNLGEPTFGWTVLPCALAVQPRHERDAAKSVVGQRELFGFKSSCFLTGFGVHREVLLETTGAASVSRLWVRADQHAGNARVRIDTDASLGKTYAVSVQLLPENFHGHDYAITQDCPIKQGQDTVSLTVPMPGAKMWQPTDPCLYRCRVTIREGHKTIDAQDVLFGVRSFTLTGAGNVVPNRPDGQFLLNDHPVYLRGADVSPALNAFWYWRQQDKLLDAVLMLKAANFNALRACEHIQFAEVRELLDRLGMMSEQDIVGAGYCPAPMSVLADLSARAARECYNNPGVVLLTAGGSETNFNPNDTVPAVLAVDPDRIIKPISGHMDNWGTAYEPPPGYPKLPDAAWKNVVDDFHCYNGWYRRTVDMWTLSKRYPPARLVTVGEYGAEGLDAYTTMQRYPTAMLPPPITDNVLWGASQVKRGDPKLTEGFRGRQPANLGEYIEASQQYQADVLAEQATGFRLSPRRIGGNFVFHFVDGLPAEWQKSIVSFDLTPKKGYFALAQVNQPVAPLFQITEQAKQLLLWVANDLPDAFPHARLAWRLTAGDKLLLAGNEAVNVLPLDATQAATIDLLPILPKTSTVTVSLTLSDEKGKLISQTRREVFLTAWQPPHFTEQPPLRARVSHLAAPATAGDARNVDWAHATQLTAWRQCEGGPTLHTVDARIAHDGQYLYLKLTESLNGPLHGADDIWSGDDWELFFSAQRTKPYRQVGMNPHGALLDLPSDPKLPLCGATGVSDVQKDRWTIYLALPLDKLVPGGLKSGSVFYGNFFRQAGGGDTFREYLAWSPNYTSSFHMPERFGELTLE